MFVSQEYVSKAWPNRERRSSLSHAVQQREEYILPVRFDDSLVPGLPTDLNYLSADQHSPAELATMIAEKLGISPFVGKASDVPPPHITSLTGEAVFDYSNHDGLYVIGRGNLEFETKWSKANKTSIRVYNYPASINGVALAKNCHSIAAVAGAAGLDFSSPSRKAQRDGIVVFRNTHGVYAAVHVLDIKDNSRGDDRDELRFRYVIQADGSDAFTEFADDRIS